MAAAPDHQQVARLHNSNRKQPMWTAQDSRRLPQLPRLRRQPLPPQTLVVMPLLLFLQHGVDRQRHLLLLPPLQPPMQLALMPERHCRWYCNRPRLWQVEMAAEMSMLLSRHRRHAVWLA